jgi:hypothetical protein
LKKKLRYNKQKIQKVCRSFSISLHQNLQEANTQMHWLIMATQGVMETKAIQFWYGILNKKKLH